MSFAFERHAGLILEVRVWGPNGSDAFRFGLDTGATETVMNVSRLAVLGYGFSGAEPTRLITGSAIASTHRLRLERILALGRERSEFPVLAYTLPAEIGVDGMLGLDFLRSLTLTLDFRKGAISLV